MHKSLPKAYEPQTTEGNIYKLWEESGFFNPDKLPKTHKKPFTIVLPPPNVTGTLHMGHAAMLAFEDIMIRYNRMKGKRALWVPGTDHAAIATQSKVEKLLYEQEGKTRHDLGREAFLKRVERYAQESHDTIVNQIKHMGASLDWSREAYTLDEPRTLAVRTAFKRMYEKGLVYRGTRIVNWCPRCFSTLSDDEVEYKETNAVLYTFHYAPHVPIAIATTRPETKLGDTAIAVHPDDKRYKQYVGASYTIDLGAGPQTIRVVADEAVDPSFGTGAVGVTPAHSSMDAEIAQRHQLDAPQVITQEGVMAESTGPYAGLPTKEARKRLIAHLKEQGLIEEEKQIPQNLSVCYRCETPVEPLPSLQWFINVNAEFKMEHSNLKGIRKGQTVTLKQLMRNAVQSGQIAILPERFEKIYYHWIDNLRDWCISRQIWYGHRIPVYYCRNKPESNSKLQTLNSKQIPNFKTQTEHLFVSIEKPKQCAVCKTCEPIQDSDTLDTWFSSGLWTFSTLGWPDNTKDLKTFHPTDVLETGYDILFFWVARMILMSTCHLSGIPFHTVYLHGLVRDDKGRKMSKSLGNVIDPLDMTTKYGADATRLSLIIGTAPGSDLKLSEDKVRGYRNFINKIWNISRFVMMRTEDYTPLKTAPKLSKEEQRIRKEFDDMAKQATSYIEKYRFSQAAELIYHYIWHTFADKVIEQSKPILEDPKKRRARQYLLIWILADGLKLLHPFAPFATEEIYQRLPLHKRKQTLMIEQWPSS